MTQKTIVTQKICKKAEMMYVYKQRQACQEIKAKKE